MSTNSAALPRLIEQVQAGLDVLVTGTPAEARVLLAEAAEQLRPTCCVVEVAAEAAGLSLSRLMAQLSGRGDLDAQDDAVLELGFRRLAVPDVPGQPIVLLLNAGHGIQRSALRFLQHVGRGAPGLVMVVTAGAELEAMLDEPAFAALRGRLTAAPAVECDGLAPAPLSEPVPMPLLAEPAPLAPAVEVEPVLPVAPPPAATPPTLAPPTLAPPRLVPPTLAPPTLAAPKLAPSKLAPSKLVPPTPVPPARVPLAPRPRVARDRGRVWAVSGAGMVASLALGAWIGHASAPRTTLVAADTPGGGPTSAATATSAPAANRPDRTPSAPVQASTTPAPATPAGHGPVVPKRQAAASRGTAFTTKIEPAEAPAPVPATPARALLAARPNPALAAAPALAQAAPVDSAPAAPAQRDAADEPAPTQESADASDSVPDSDSETLRARAPGVSALPPEAAEPAPAPKPELAAAPPVLAPEQPVQASSPASTSDEPRQGEGATGTRAKLALARPAAPDDMPVPPSPPKADPSSRAWHSKRSEPRPKDGPAPMAERQPRAPHASFREPEAARYDWEDQGPPPSYSVPPEWNAPRSGPAAERPYLGTYAAGPYGMRMFRYER